MAMNLSEIEDLIKKALPDAVIDIGQHYTIFDLDVRINIVHTNVFDLQIFLQGPSGERVCLNMYDFEKNFFVGQNYIDTIFDDQADIAIADGSVAFTYLQHKNPSFTTPNKINN